MDRLTTIGSRVDTCHYDPGQRVPLWGMLVGCVGEMQTSAGLFLPLRLRKSFTFWSTSLELRGKPTASPNTSRSTRVHPLLLCAPCKDATQDCQPVQTVAELLGKI